MHKVHVILNYFVTAIVIAPPADAYVRFTVKPDDPSYVSKGHNVKLMWDYNPNDQPTAIIFGVAVQRSTLVPLLVKQNGSVRFSRYIPSAYKGRVKLEGRATLVIKNITSRDNFVFFQCALVPGGPSIIQLVLMGMYSSFKVFKNDLKN
ncbi:uncharacterized protein LOC111344782 [Stylophora pistillata]|uniref:uncharacterized protein LOC111344782 n=1 Tax=Stylophora pistillata TaxID=50429 RepID=UPI000C038D8F|nr:uncharacterized protein LOC111344782 [Stylophora pistillata]